MAHGFPDELAKSREEALYRKTADHEIRKPPQRFIEDGWDQRPFRPIAECAQAFGVDKSTVSRWYAWVRKRDAAESITADIPRPDGLPESHFDWTEDHVDILIDGFLDFRESYFTTERGKPYLSPDFQVEWARALITTKVTGGNKMILAPVRHGKTALLTHFCIYLFCLDPNIRVLWLGVTQSLSEGPLKQMRGIFEGNKALIEDYAGKDRTFQPAVRALQKWTDKELTLATRTNMEIAGPNVVALGRGGTIIGRNADIIIVDDIEDQDAVAQKHSRDKTKEWWITQLGSRKEEHTGMFVIGSRQNHDDIYSLIMREPGWDVSVERAHDLNCDLPEDDVEAHVDCLLFPEVRTWRWLLNEKERAKHGPHGVALWERIFQNLERIDNLVVFPEDDVKACRSANYYATTMPTQRDHDAASWRLVGGLDPAKTGHQASVLLAYQTRPELKVWLVDIDNERGGGFEAAASLMQDWYDKYGLTHWVVEENLLGPATDYPRIRELTQRHGIYVQDFGTYGNKADRYFGVTALAPLFKNRNFVLPYPQTDEGRYSRQITDELVSQLLVWDEGNSRNKNRTGVKDDLVMALWFAWDPIRRAQQVFSAELGVDTTDALTSAMASDWDDAPWDDWSLAV